MKTIFSILIFLCLATAGYAQEESPVVYIIRDTGSMGSMTNFEVFVDDQLICELKNNSYIKPEIATGTHKFSVQMTGHKSKSSVDHFELNIEAGKTYYLKVETPGSVMGSTSFTEITENSANKIMPGLNEQGDCN